MLKRNHDPSKNSGCLWKKHKLGIALETSGVLKMFYIFNWMVFIQEYTYVKSQNVYLKTKQNKTKEIISMCSWIFTVCFLLSVGLKFFRIKKLWGKGTNLKEKGGNTKFRILVRWGRNGLWNMKIRWGFKDITIAVFIKPNDEYISSF